MKITQKKIRNYTEITAENGAGLNLRLTSLGAAIREIKLPDRSGELKTMTLCPVDEDIYATCYHGKTIGRTAGRIAGATFSIGGKTATLEKNNHGTDNLHGGKSGFHAALFDTTVEKHDDFTDVVFTYFSPDGEGGYFGNVNVKITYRIFESENTFRIIFDGTSDADTLLNMTNHVYLNLSGNLSESIKDHELYINASRYGVLNSNLIIENTAAVTREMDFTEQHKIGDYIYADGVQRYTNGYDHQYFLDTSGFDDVACVLRSPSSGIALTMRTTYPCVVFYANSCPNTDWEIYPGRHDEQYLSACLECQYHPNGIHVAPELCHITSPAKPYHEEVEYKFTSEK